MNPSAGDTALRPAGSSGCLKAACVLGLPIAHAVRKEISASLPSIYFPAGHQLTRPPAPPACMPLHPGV